ncbi:isoflavone 3'-hydroxylase-like [Iris pallida]|uniref:Isoflavone 3'-hydroxylase-like n=1 Tax=Iris pallida TaxID=29817 RepID=A0AAX6EN16_IRIPA|nr:isoflavone 3'-hydroxylase-like [Iris pallida]
MHSLQRCILHIEQINQMEYNLVMYSATPFAAAAIVGILILLICRRSPNKNLPPAVPFALPIIGHMHLVLASGPLHHTLAKFCAKYGPVLSLRLGIRRVLVVSSLSAAEECLTKNDIVFANRPTNVFSGKHLSYDYTTLISAPYGPLWRDLRRFSTAELFSTARTSALSYIREVEMEAMVAGLLNSSAPVDGDGYRRVNLMMLLREVVSNMFTQMLVGKRYFGDSKTVKAEEGNKFDALMAEGIELAESLSLRDWLPAVKWLGINKFKKRIEWVDKEFDIVLQEVLDECRKQHLDKSNQDKEEKRKTLLDVMILLQQKDPKFYTDTIIKGTMLIFIIGGTDPPASMMEWQLSLLLNHPEVLQKVRDEIDTHVGHDRLITDSDVPKLQYLTNVIKESLRLYPSGPLLVAHESSADCTVAGYDVPRGTMLLVHAHALQRNPSLWEDPDSFKLERWFEIDQEAKSLKFLPFGYGRRMCPAEFMSMRLMVLVVGSLVQCFEFKRTSEVVDMTEADSMNLKRAVTLEAYYKPRHVMMPTLSQFFK